jgi:hypothetical protein
MYFGMPFSDHPKFDTRSLRAFTTTSTDSELPLCVSYIYEYISPGGSGYYTHVRCGGVIPNSTITVFGSGTYTGSSPAPASSHTPGTAVSTIFEYLPTAGTRPQTTKAPTRSTSHTTIPTNEHHGAGSGGTIAGIVLGVVLFILLVAAGIIVVQRNNRKSRKRKDSTPLGTLPPQGIFRPSSSR